MLKFNKNVEERKTIAHRIGELTGIQPFYTRAPLYTYEVGPYIIDREGNLLVDENQADPEILTALMSEGLITGGEVIDTDAPVDETEFPATEEPPIDDDTLADDETPEEDADPQEMDTAPQEDSGDETEGGEPEHEESSNYAEDGEPIEDGAPTENGAPTEDGDTAEAADGSVDMSMNFPIPIGQHSGTSLRNLVNLIYSRGALISRATGGHFSVDEELVEALKDDTCAYTKANFLAMLSDYEAQHGEALHGLKITEDEVIFTGFGRAADMDTLTAYGQLAVLMNDQALTQKRIQAKHVNDANEKYAMRIWLIRIGMGGAEFKKTRAILMKPLGGHTAFRTPEEAQKAKEKAQRQRDALKAAKLAAQGSVSEGGEASDAAQTAPTQPDCGADNAQENQPVLEAGA